MSAPPVVRPGLARLPILCMGFALFYAWESKLHGNRHKEDMDLAVCVSRFGLSGLRSARTGSLIGCTEQPGRLCRLCRRERQAETGSYLQSSGTNRFTGVYWLKSRQKFQALVWFNGKVHYAGVFENATEAAFAFDAKLRVFCKDPVRRKKSLNFPTQQEVAFSRAKQAESRRSTSKFNGVSWHKEAQRFMARVWFQDRPHFAGLFSNETAAACAFDAKLRGMCKDPVRLKRSLNFPTQQEASHRESLLDIRARSMRTYSQSRTKEVDSFQRLQDRLSTSKQASDFEIVHIPSQSRVDALFQSLKSKSEGLPLQLKSSSCYNRSGRASFYSFGSTNGYDGMLLVLIALDRDMIWMVPGKDVSQTCLKIILGSQRDRAWRVEEVGLALTDYFRSASFAHVSFQNALLQCGQRHIVEEQSHAQLASVFALVGLQLARPVDLMSMMSTVDSTLRLDGQGWRVQEKATHRLAGGEYRANLWKHGGSARICKSRL